MEDSPELKTDEEIPPPIQEKVAKPKKSIGRPPANEEQLEKKAKKARERTASNNGINRERLKETLSIKAEVEELKKSLMPFIQNLKPTASETSEPKKEEVIKEMPTLTNPEVKAPTPSGPKKLTKEERIKLAIFGRY